MTVEWKFSVFFLWPFHRDSQQDKYVRSRVQKRYINHIANMFRHAHNNQPLFL